MRNKNSILVWSLIVIVFIGGVIFLNKNNKQNDTMENTAQVAKLGDTVRMNYTGKLTDGTVFDSSVDPKFGHVKPYEFTLGAREVIAGWDKGIVGMHVGDKKQLVIPPEDAYGVVGIPGTIPGNATLTFDVELVSIKNK